MLTAITRGVSSAIAECELTFLERRPIDLARAAEQHRDYELLLTLLGARVISLPAEPHLPDSVFVEDTALVLDEAAIVFAMGAASRRRETISVSEVLLRYRPVENIVLPGTMEGGDVLRIGRKLFVGISRRTNNEGIRQLTAIAARMGYEVTPVPVTGCLHLKSACTYLGENTLLGNRLWIDAAPFAGYEWIEVPEEERAAANALAVGGKVILPESYPRTRAVLEKRGFTVVSLDISELQKAEAGLTCSCLLFEDASSPDP
jgi:dimethylargininase